MFPRRSPLLLFFCLCAASVFVVILYLMDFTKHGEENYHHTSKLQRGQHADAKDADAKMIYNTYVSVKIEQKSFTSPEATHVGNILSLKSSFGINANDSTTRNLITQIALNNNVSSSEDSPRSSESLIQSVEKSLSPAITSAAEPTLHTSVAAVQYKFSPAESDTNSNIQSADPAEDNDIRLNNIIVTNEESPSTNISPVFVHKSPVPPRAHAPEQLGNNNILPDIKAVQGRLDSRLPLKTMENIFTQQDGFEDGNSEETADLPSCPNSSPFIKPVFGFTEMILPWDLLQEHLRMLSPGGSWKPVNCNSPESVAIIIPYRNREDNLKSFIYHMHPFLQRQQANYRIYVVEQTGTELFNRGALMNAGFLFAMAFDSHDCFITHDVDMLPMNDWNYYRCSNNPHHLTSNVQQFNYGIPYNHYVGGAIALRKDQFLDINGYSNLYFGWGGEDDDLFERMKAKNVTFQRSAEGVGVYASLNTGHHREAASDARHGLLQTAAQRQTIEGLTSLKHTIVGHQNTSLFTRVVVRLHEEVMMENYRAWLESQYNPEINDNGHILGQARIQDITVTAKRTH